MTTGWTLDETNLKLYILGENAKPARRVGISIEKVQNRFIMGLNTYGMEDPPAPFPKPNFVLTLEQLIELVEAAPSIIKQYKESAGIKEPKAKGSRSKRGSKADADQDVDMDGEDDEMEEEEEEEEEEMQPRKGKNVKVNVSQAVPAPRRGASAEAYAEIDDDDFEATEALEKDIEDVRQGDKAFVSRGEKNLKDLLEEKAGSSKRASTSRGGGRKRGRK